MNQLLALLSLFAFAGVLAYAQDMKKVNVTVYYESRCPDSKAFITKQLFPLYNKTQFKERMTLVLVPYGISEKKEGSSVFTCHHGPEECTGNAYEGCALTNNLTMDDAINYINCISLDTTGSKDYDKLTDNCTSPANAAIIKECASNETNILEMMRMKTDEFTKGKKLTNVPTVVVDKETLTGNFQLLNTVCKMLSDDKLADCPAPSSAAHHYLSFVAMMAGALLLTRW